MGRRPTHPIIEARCAADHHGDIPGALPPLIEQACEFPRTPWTAAFIQRDEQRMGGHCPQQNLTLTGLLLRWIAGPGHWRQVAHPHVELAAQALEVLFAGILYPARGTPADAQEVKAHERPQSATLLALLALGGAVQSFSSW